MATRNFEIQLNNLTLDGKACTNPTITWDQPSCGNIKCILQNGRVIKVELPEDCKECFYVYIDCDNTCSDCEIQRLKICPCRADIDCPDCEVCGPSGYCVSTCPEDQFCSDGECKECDDTHPCPCNQLCVDGKCECPPDLPYKNSKGCCSECAMDSHCPPCFVCTPDGCVPKVCPVGVCDPDTNECVECYNSGHCPVNECCVNGHCECCQGFYKDPLTGNCVPNPSCDRDADCPPCHICNAGFCVPVTCPPGYVRTSGDPCCKPECDCNNPNCTHGANCLQDIASGDCYCEACGQSCVNGETCPPGCYCDGNSCVPNPCYGPCAHGADCGPGCGCLNGVCVPCNSVDCEDCNDIDGCNCTDGVNCRKSCSGPCFGAGDCAPGCGCFEGECIPCSELTCSECPQAFGCKCLNGKCTEDPCKDNLCQCISCNGIEDCGIGCYCNNGTCTPNPCDGPCSGSDNCAPGCYCVGGRCVPCVGPCGDDGNPTNDPPCTDALKITKIEAGCDLEGKLTTTKCCQCGDITAGFDFTDLGDSGTNAVTNLIIYLHKGGATNWTDFLALPNLPSTGIINDYPDSGSIRVTVKTYLAPADVNCNLINGGTPITDTQSHLYDFSGTWMGSHGFTYPKSGNCVTIAGQKYVVVKNEITVKTETEFVFPNECKYRIKEYLAKTVTANTLITDNSDFPIILTKDAACRKPLFTWYKSTNKAGLISNGNIFRRKYADRSGTMFVDKLFDYLQDGLEYGKYYGLQTDCGCSGSSVFDCNGDQSADRLTYNYPLNFNVTVDTCGYSLTFDEVLVDCDVMLQSPIRPRYQVLINGKVVDTITLPASGVLIAAGTNYALVPAEKVTSVTIKLLDTDCPYEITKNVSSLGLNLTLSYSAQPCGASNIDITMTVTGGTGPYNYTVYRDNVNIAAGSFATSPGTVSVPRVDGNYRVDITDGNGCTVSGTFVYNDSTNTLETLLDITTSCIGSSGYIHITNNSGFDVNVSIDAGPNVTLNNGSTGQYLVSVGTHTVDATLVVDPLCGFVGPINVNVDCCDDPDVTVTQTCAPNGSKEITITNNGSQTVSAQIMRASDLGLVASCASILPFGFCVKTNLQATDAHNVVVTGVGSACTSVSIPVPTINCSDCNIWKNNVVLNYTCSGSTVNWTITNLNTSGSANVTGSYVGVIAPGGSQAGSGANVVTFNVVRADDATCSLNLSASCSEGCSALDLVTIIADCSDPYNPLFNVNNPGGTNISIYKDNVLYSNTSAVLTIGSFTSGSSTLIRVDLQSNPICNKSQSLSCTLPPSVYTVSYDCVNGIVISGAYAGQVNIDNGPTNHTYPTSSLFLRDGAHTVKLLLDGSTHNLNVACCTHTAALDVVCDNGQPSGQKGTANVTMTNMNIGNSYTVNLYTAASTLVSSSTIVTPSVVNSVTFSNLPDGSYYAVVLDNTYNSKTYVGSNTLGVCTKTTAIKVIDCETLGSPCSLNVLQSDFTGTVCVGAGNSNCFNYSNNTGFNVTVNAFYLLIGGGSCFDEANPNWILNTSIGLTPGGNTTIEAPSGTSCVKFEIVKDASCEQNGWLTIDSGGNITGFHFYV